MSPRIIEYSNIQELSNIRMIKYPEIVEYYNIRISLNFKFLEYSNIRIKNYSNIRIIIRILFDSVNTLVQ